MMWRAKILVCYVAENSGGKKTWQAEQKYALNKCKLPFAKSSESLFRREATPHAGQKLYWDAASPQHRVNQEHPQNVDDRYNGREHDGIVQETHRQHP
jgi:hypothetical protein